MIKRKILLFINLFCMLFLLSSADAYKLVALKELGSSEAKNQNATVTCTTTKGELSRERCILRRYALCKNQNNNTICNGWKAWKNVHSPVAEFATWKAGAEACCREKGLR